MAIQDSERKYTRAQCEYKGKWKRHLKGHIKLIHESERHPCPQCDYKARQSQHLRQHVKLFIKVLPTHVTCVTTKHLQNPVSIVTS